MFRFQTALYFTKILITITVLYFLIILSGLKRAIIKIRYFNNFAFLIYFFLVNFVHKNKDVIKLNMLIVMLNAQVIFMVKTLLLSLTIISIYSIAIEKHNNLDYMINDCHLFVKVEISLCTCRYLLQRPFCCLYINTLQ